MPESTRGGQKVDTRRVSDAIADRADVSPKEAMERAKKKAKIAQLLKRGPVNDLLVVRDLPADRRAVYARKNEQDIMKYENLGYRVETVYGKTEKEGEDHAADSTRVLGDVILMTTDRENYDLILEVKAEQLEGKLDVAKREYLTNAKTNPDVPVFGGQQ